MKLMIQSMTWWKIKKNIFNHSKYISQKQKVNKLKESYKNEINNKIKSISYNYDLFNVDDYLFLTEKCDSELVKMFSNQGYWSLENFYFTKDFTDKIDYYKKNIKKYVKSYNRYLNKMKNVIDCYDKRFCSKNKYDKLDLTK